MSTKQATAISRLLDSTLDDVDDRMTATNNTTTTATMDIENHAYDSGGGGGNDRHLRRRNGASSRSAPVKCLCHAISFIRYFPFVMISALFVWGAYVYFYFIIHLGYGSRTTTKCLLVLAFVPLYVLSTWSYLRTVFARNRQIPDEFAIPDELNLNLITEDEINRALEHVISVRNLPIYTRSFGGYVRYCRKCFVLKPDRCHHCSTCGKCVRKMDHHCHWVSNCVAFDNYKYFIQFLAYTVALAVYTAGSSMPLFVKFWRDEDYAGRFQVFFLVVFCAVFSMSILFLLSYHIYLVARNMSTLEAYQPPRFKNSEHNFARFNLGACRNFRAVFGDDRVRWFVPLPSNFGDGLHFDIPLNPAQIDKSSNSLITNGATGPAGNNQPQLQQFHNHGPALMEHQHQLAPQQASLPQAQSSNSVSYNQHHV